MAEYRDDGGTTTQRLYGSKRRTRARGGDDVYNIPICIAAERAHKGHSCAVHHNIIIVYYCSECTAASVYGDSGVKSSVCARGECIYNNTCMH